MGSIEGAAQALYRDPALAAYGFVLAGSVERGEALVRSGVTHVLARRLRSGDLAERVRERMVAVQCAALRSEVSTADAVVSPGALDVTDAAVAALDPWVRVAMVLRYRDDRDVDAVAKALRLKPSEVEALLTTGREQLAAALGISPAHVTRMSVEGGAQ